MNCEGIGWQAKAPAPQRLTMVLHFVGRAPWPAVDPLVDLLERRKGRTRGSGADGGVRPTFGCGYAAFVGQTLSSVNPGAVEKAVS
jgi:hypothetical protein